MRRQGVDAAAVGAVAGSPAEISWRAGKPPQKGACRTALRRRRRGRAMEDTETPRCIPASISGIYIENILCDVGPFGLGFVAVVRAP